MDPGSEAKLHHQPLKQDPRLSDVLPVWPTKFKLRHFKYGNLFNLLITNLAVKLILVPIYTVYTYINTAVTKEVQRGSKIQI